MTTNNYDAMCLFSAGLDSTVAAAILIRGGMNVLLIHIGQEQGQHLRQAEKLTKHFQFDQPRQTIGLETADFNPVIRKVRKGNYVPGYRAFNMITALAFADKYDIRAIYTGELEACFDPNSYIRGTIDPDDIAFTEFLGMGDDVKQMAFREAWKPTRTKLADWYSQTYKGGDDYFQFIDPLSGLHKPGVIKLGQALDVPFAMTVTCRNREVEMNDEVFHCGLTKCWACNQRRSAFAIAEVKDPTRYKFDEPIDRQYYKKAVELAWSKS